MRFYTRLGDQGMTDLLGDRVRKDDSKIELIGALDEATSSIGLARSVAASAENKEWLIEIQRDLYLIMAELAFTDELRPEAYTLKEERVDRLEALTDDLAARVDLPPQFILPGDTFPAATLDVARTIVRRAERIAVTLAGSGPANPEIVRYLNRLSSFLFIAARFEDAEAGVIPLKAKQKTT
jgi:cob(I)alamin adenosyltransferase